MQGIEENGREARRRETNLGKCIVERSGCRRCVRRGGKVKKQSKVKESE